MLCEVRRVVESDLARGNLPLFHPSSLTFTLQGFSVYPEDLTLRRNLDLLLLLLPRDRPLVEPDPSVAMLSALRVMEPPRLTLRPRPLRRLRSRTVSRGLPAVLERFSLGERLLL